MKKSAYLVLVFLVLSLSTFLAFWKLDQFDLDGNEAVYVASTIRFSQHDPQVVPRHNLRRLQWPSAPYPFLTPWINGFFLQSFKPTLLSVRFLYALSIPLSTLIVILLSKLIFRSRKISLISALIFTTTPLVLRFGRMAVLDPPMAVFAGLMIIFLWLSFQSYKPHCLLSLFAGTFAAFTVTAKLTGIFYLLAALFLYFCSFFLFRRKFSFKKLFLFLLSFSVMFILLNDPASYIYGWTNFKNPAFNDPRTQRINLVSIARGIIDYKYWLKFSFVFLGILPALLLLISPSTLYKKARSTNKFTLFFLTLFTLAPASYLIINPSHITGISSQWAYFPLILMLSLTMGYSFYYFFHRRLILSLVIYILLMSLPLSFFGLRLKPIPWSYPVNTTIGELPVTQTLALLNQQPPGKVLLHAQHSITPLWMISSSHPTEPFYHPIENYEYVLTDIDSTFKQAKYKGFSTLSSLDTPHTFPYHLLKKQN